MDLKNSIVYKTIEEEYKDFIDTYKDNIINKDINDLLYLLELNNSPMIKQCINHVKNNRLILVYNENFLNSSIRFINHKDNVLINCTKYAKLKKHSGDRRKFVINSDHLYSLLIEGLATLYHDKILAYNRDYLNDAANLYMEIIPRLFTKGGNFFSNTDKVKKFHFLMLYFLFTHNTTIVANPEGYVSRLTEIRQDDVKVLKTLYDFEKIKKMDFEEYLNEVLKNEFKFMQEMNLNMIIYNATLVFGAENISIVDNLSIMCQIMTDCIIGNRPTLNATNSIFKNLVKSTMYNNILSVIADRL